MQPRSSISGAEVNCDEGVQWLECRGCWLLAKRYHRGPTQSAFSSPSPFQHRTGRHERSDLPLRCSSQSTACSGEIRDTSPRRCRLCGLQKTEAHVNIADEVPHLGLSSSSDRDPSFQYSLHFELLHVSGKPVAVFHKYIIRT